MTLRPEKGKNHKTMPELTAQETVALAASIREELAERPEMRPHVALQMETDSIWRTPALNGYLVDKQALEQQKQIVADARRYSRRYFGRDLLYDIAALEWMHENGVVCVDKKGKPTLERAALADASVPDSLRDEWTVFVEMRLAKGLAGALKNIESHTVTLRLVGTTVARRTVSVNLEGPLGPGRLVISADAPPVE
jgi:hypothetical protein